MLRRQASIILTSVLRDQYRDLGRPTVTHLGPSQQTASLPSGLRDRHFRLAIACCLSPPKSHPDGIVNYTTPTPIHTQIITSYHPRSARFTPDAINPLPANQKSRIHSMIIKPPNKSQPHPKAPQAWPNIQQGTTIHPATAQQPIDISGNRSAWLALLPNHLPPPPVWLRNLPQPRPGHATNSPTEYFKCRSPHLGTVTGAEFISTPT